MNSLMKNVVRGALAGSLAVSMFSCGDDVAVTGYDESKTSGTIDMAVLKKVDGEPLDSATIKVFVNGKENSAITDSNGLATIAGLPAGNYTVRVSKDGYADMNYKANLSLAGATDMPVVEDLDIDVEMSKEGVDLQGYVKLVDVDGNKVPQADVTVDLELPGTTSFAKKRFTATTDESGMYTFDNLPELTSYSVSPRRFEAEDGVYTGGTEVVASMVASSAVFTVDPITLSPEATSLSIDYMDKELTASQSLTVKFSEPVDVEEVDFNDITVGSVAITTTWADDNKTLTITPVGGDWGESGTFSASFRVSTVGGSDQSLARSFTVGESGTAASVTGLAKTSPDTITVLTSTVYIEWNELDDVDGYQVAKKEANDDAFVIVETNTYASDTTAYVTGLDFEDGATVQIKVISYAGNTTSSWEDATTLTLEAGD